jgi:hypothetical protein
MCLETDIHTISRHLAEMRRLIERQMELISAWANMGYDTRRAQLDLETMLAELRALEKLAKEFGNESKLCEKPTCQGNPGERFAFVSWH